METLFNISTLANTSSLFYSRDCHEIQLELCQHLSSNTDIALMMIGVGIFFDILRGWIRPYLTMEELRDKKSQRLIGNIILYIDDSILPELCILMGFIFLAFIRMNL